MSSWSNTRESGHRRIRGSQSAGAGTLWKMRILIDECSPAALRGTALGYQCETVRRAPWAGRSGPACGIRAGSVGDMGLRTAPSAFARPTPPARGETSPPQTA